jgi:uncharacterized membrane protein YdjX (TVP38/TMEM64 family)
VTAGKAEPRDRARRGTLWRRLPLLVVALAAVTGLVFFRDALSFDALARHQAWLVAQRDASYLPTVLGFIAAYVAIVALSLPGATVATLAGGFLFGLFPGVVFNVLAAGTGAILVFLAARAGIGADVARRAVAGGGQAARLIEGLKRNEWSMLLVMRLLPLVPFFLANLIPAFVGTSTWRFAVTTFAGILPGTFILTSIGSGLAEVFARGTRPDLSILTEPRILLPLVGLAALAALPFLVRLLRGKPAA